MFSQFLDKYKFFLIYFLIIFVVYLKLIIFGGLNLGDEATLILRSIDNEQVFSYSKHFERPISNIFYNYFHNLYSDNLFLYNLTSVILWVIFSINIFLIIKKFFNNTFSNIFLIIISFPFFSSTLVFGVHLFCSYTFSLLFWSYSLLFFIYYSYSNKKIHLTFGFLFLLFSLFTLSYIFPLLLFNIFLPLKNKNLNILQAFKKNKNLFFKLFYITSFGVITFLTYKLYFGNYFGKNNIYGISPSLYQSIYYFYSITAETTILLFKSLLRFNYESFIIFVLIFFFIYFLKKDSLKVTEPNDGNDYYDILILAIISLLSCSLIFFISGYPAITFGYYNRMLAPAFIPFSLLFSYIIYIIFYKRFFYISIFLTYMVVHSMNLQTDNNIQAWNTKKFIIQDIKNNLIINNFLENKNNIVVANVPYFVNKNYNNEGLFMTKWSLNSTFKLFEINKLYAYTINYRILTDKNFYAGHNFINNNSINKIDFNENNVFYYQYTYQSEPIFIKIENTKSLQKLINISIKNKINNESIIFREKIRMYFKKKFT